MIDNRVKSYDAYMYYRMHVDTECSCFASCISLLLYIMIESIKRKHIHGRSCLCIWTRGREVVSHVDGDLCKPLNF